MNAMSDELAKKAVEYEASLAEQAQIDAQAKTKQDQDNAERNAAAEKQRKENEIYIAEQRQIERKSIDDFGKLIAVGTKTNCGLVIERKPTIVQVYIPVKDYGNEHWIEINRLYPQGYACNFINGTYVDPSYKF